MLKFLLFLSFALIPLIRGNDVEIVLPELKNGSSFDSSENVFNVIQSIVIDKEKPLTTLEKWNKAFPTVNADFTFVEEERENRTIYGATCRIHFDRPVSEYNVHFLADNKSIGAYNVNHHSKSMFFHDFSLNLYLFLNIQ